MIGILVIANIWIVDFFINDIPENIKLYVIIYSGLLQISAYMNMCRRNYSYYSTLNAIVGSLLFIISDFMIGLEEFKKVGGQWINVAIHLTYFVA